MESTERLHLDIAGMSCEHCVNAVTSALSQVPGVTVEQVEIGHATVAYDPGQTAPQSVVDAVNDEGYTASVAS
jgi:copper chaperone CopZ